MRLLKKLLLLLLGMHIQVMGLISRVATHLGSSSLEGGLKRHGLEIRRGHHLGQVSLRMEACCAVHAAHMGGHVGRHVAAVLEGFLLLGVGCSQLCFVAGSGGGCIDSVQVHCMAANNEGRCQLWGTAEVQVDIAGKDILPGVTLGDCLSPWHLCNQAVGHYKALIALGSCCKTGSAKLRAPQLH